jgi:hypothetical protein
MVCGSDRADGVRGVGGRRIWVRVMQSRKKVGPLRYACYASMEGDNSIASPSRQTPLAVGCWHFTA